MAPARWLFWHRRDLRFGDNLGLAAAAAATPALTGVYVFDPEWLEAADLAPARLWFLCESLRELQQRWRQAGSELLLVRGRPIDVLPRLAQACAAEVVTWNRDVEPAARQRDRQVAAALQASGRRVLVDWDQLLVPPEEIRTGSGEPYRVYGPFLRNWRGQVTARDAAGLLTPGAAPQGLVGWDRSALEPEAHALWQDLPLLAAVPTAAELGHPFDGEALCPCRPGEQAAAAQLEAFADGGASGSGHGAALFAYEPGRNIPSEAGTSALSAALSLGCLSPRQAWLASEGARLTARSDEALASITVWQQELAWREFYQHALFHFPELADGPYRPQWRQFPWDNQRPWFEAWRQGLTGMPFVDAAMRQLNASGWMHNRCRMVVASFLVKDLICDWRWGETAFMQRLVDGDLAANNGGWQWSASSGMDPKPLRIFNPATQAGRFDGEASYIRTWLPELAHVATADLISGDIAPLERGDYPAPLVDHRLQQARFKVLYAGLAKP